MVDTTKAYDLLINGSVIEAANEVYAATVGIWLWPIIFVVTLVVIHIKTENPSYLVFYSILGNYLIGTYIVPLTHPIFYGIFVFSLFAVLWKIFGSTKTE